MVLKRCSSERGEREKRFYRDGKGERRRTAFCRAAQNSLGPVCPVPLTEPVRRMASAATSELRRPMGEEPIDRRDRAGRGGFTRSVVESSESCALIRARAKLFSNCPFLGA